MAALVLGAAGSALGAGFGGTILGLSGSAIGGLIGSTVGSVIDSAIVASLQPGQRVEGARLENLRITSSTEGAVIPRLYGRMRIGGNVIWATDFVEEVSTAQSGGKGGGPRVTTTEYLYSASFALALCEGPITGIGRIWADGSLMEMEGVTWRWYPGDEDQEADPFIESKMGADDTPAYRGVAYVVFEALALQNFGNRLPQLSFEVFRPLAEDDSAEGLVQAVTMIPASGEFAYATAAVKKTGGGATDGENVNAEAETADMVVSLDRLQAQLPTVGSVSLVVSWFGDDLRAGICTIRPKVEIAEKDTTPAWRVNGLTRAGAQVVSTVGGNPVFGGTPADFSVVQAIQNMKARGLRVTFYPFLMMDVPSGNTLPDPYSDNAAGVGQAVLPWRGRITCSPAAGYAGTVDKTATAATQVAAFFGNAVAGDFTVTGTQVDWTGGTDWGLRRMILHYAHLCAAAGGVDAFLIGSEMRGLTTIRSGLATYPAVQAFADLAAAVSAILGSGTKVSYAADWSEYFGHQPADQSGDVMFHLDPLWADASIDFVAIDNYMPLSDWRDGWDHLDAQDWPVIYDQGYLRANVAGGEGFDWFYASPADRDAQWRTPITDGAYDEPWVFRYKDVRSWWSNTHVSRQHGVRLSLLSDGPVPDAWIGFSGATVAPLPGLFNGRFSRSATITGSNSPLDGAESADFAVLAASTYRVEAWVSEGTSGDARLYIIHASAQAYVRFTFATQELVAATGSLTFANVTAVDEGGGIWKLGFDVVNASADSTVQVRVTPGFSTATTVRLHAASVIRVGFDTAVSPWVPQSKPIWFTELGCPAVDRGTNQPNVFFDEKSSESAVPYHSRGWRDDAIQRAYLDATFGYWGEAANNPVSAVYAAPMVHLPECAVWTWDARPYPFFPQLTDVWADAENWRLGHWLTGRMGSVALGALVRHLCLRAGMDAAKIDVSGLWGAVEGYVITAFESPRTSLSSLARLLAFDAVESEGVVRFVMRGGRPVARLQMDGWTGAEPGVVTQPVAAGSGETREIVRGQETELPQALHWTVARSDDSDYASVMVEARRVTASHARLTAESFAFAIAPEQAERQCYRALAEAWTAREALTTRLPPSMLALDPADVIEVQTDGPSGGHLFQARIMSVGDSASRAIEALRQDRDIYDMAPGSQRPARLRRPLTFGTPDVAVMDLPPLYAGREAHQPLVAAHARPWPGEIAMYKSATLDGFAVLGSFGYRAQMGVLTAPLARGPVALFDRGSVLDVEFSEGTMASVTDLALLNGANALAVETAAGQWEIVQAGVATLLAPRQYRLTRLLRGLRGTDWAMGDPAPAGARVVLLTAGLESLPITTTDLWLAWNFRFGPAARAVSDDSYVTVPLTPQGQGLRPFAPVHLRAVLDSGGDVALSWIRQSRDLAADNWALFEVPLAEESELYQVEILASAATLAAVLRSVTLGVAQFAYSVAAQTADFGAPLITGDSLTFRVTQVSAAVGLGIARTTTATL